MFNKYMNYVIIAIFILLSKYLVNPNVKSTPSIVSISKFEEETNKLTEKSIVVDKDDIAKSSYTVVHQMYHQLKSFIENIIKKMDMTRKVYNSWRKFEKLQVNTSLSLDEVVEAIIYGLEVSSEEFLRYMSGIDDQMKWMVTKLNESLINNTADLDSYTIHIKQEIRSLNNTVIYKKGCKVIDRILGESAEKLEKCCQLSIKTMHSLCNLTGSVLTQYLNVILDSVDKVQACIEDKTSYSNYLLSCLNLAYEDISTKLTQIWKLMHDTLPVEVIFSKECIAIILVDMDDELMAKYDTLDFK